MIATPCQLPESLRVAAPQLKVWRFDLDQPVIDHEAACLDADEQGRAARFVLPVHRQRFVAAHACMRALLAAELGTVPASLRFASGDQGKPSLAGHPGSFNLSHSQGTGLLVWSPAGGEWGIDVECVRDMPDAPAVAERVYTRAERQAWLSLPAAERAMGFMTLWARKEACLKATGSGLVVAPQRFEAGYGHGDGPTAVELPDAQGQPRSVQVWDLHLPPGEAAAVARCAAPQSAHPDLSQRPTA
jgi:4'-phosphopantetheinyl transferase